MPKALPKVSFSAPFDSHRQAEIMGVLVDSITGNAPKNDVLVLASLCKSFIRQPSEASLRRVLSFSPSEAMCQDSFYKCQQLIALLKKNAGYDVGVDTKAVAVESFWLSEKLCAETNRKLRSLDDPDYRERATLIFEMSRKISKVLGDLPPLSEFDFAFGPGSSIGVSKNTSARFKLQSGSATVEAYRLLGRVLDSVQATSDVFEHWPGLKDPEFVSGSRFTTVPKTSLTDRGINVEPTVNSYLQKGIGSYVRRRLQRFGVDLDDQSINQRLARKGSLDGSLATIDLSMASDTISSLLVLDLLPIEWYSIMDSCRSPMVQVDKTWTFLEKFSAMGNGYTFELESLIFWAVLSVSCPAGSCISVYGDDMICPVEYVDVVIHNLELLGFRTNVDKTFSSGSFRESCGKDYWDGTDVRPVFLKEKLSIKELYRLHNFFIRTGRMDNPESLLRFIPKSWRHYGPDGYGDGHLIGTTPVKYDKRGWEPFYRFKSFRAVPRKVRTELNSDYGCFLYHSRKSNDMLIEDFMFNERSSQPHYRIGYIRVPADI